MTKEMHLKWTDLSNIKLRNALRGLQSNTDYVTKKKTLNTARTVVGNEDISLFSQFLSELNLDEVCYGSPFPRDQKSLLSRTKSISPIPFVYEAEIQWSRLKKNSEKLIKASALIQTTNTQILRGNFEESFETLSEWHKEFGVSATLYRKVLYTYFKAQEINKINGVKFTTKTTDKLFPILFSGGESNAFSHYLNSLIDFFDSRTDLISLIQNNNKTISNMDITGRLYPVQKRMYFPCSVSTLIDDEQFVLTSTSSVIDSMIDLASIIAFQKWTPTLNDELDKTISQLIESFWQVDALIDNFLCLEHGEDLDRSFYRASTAFSEIRDFLEYRQVLDAQLSQRNASIVTRETQVKSFFLEDLKLKYLGIPKSTKLRQIEFFDNSSAGDFLRTFAVINRLNLGDKFSDLKSDQIRILLSQTSGFHHLLSIPEIYELKEVGDHVGNEVIKFLAMLMLHYRLPNDDDLYDLRQLFQSLLKMNFRGSILEFLDWLNKRTPSLCRNIIDLCDIPFLEKMYKIFSNFEEALLVREDIFRWAAESLKAPEYLIAADRLVLDAKVREIRGDIDDTRIYVDELRFGTWLTENIVPELRKVGRIAEVSGVKAGGDNPIIIPNGCRQHLNLACEVAYKEFCENTVFGVNSYLARRIRHGSFRGQLYSNIKEIVRKYILDNCEEKPAHKLSLEAFLEAYKEIVENTSKQYLHFKTIERPLGLLSSDYKSVGDKINVLNRWHEDIIVAFSAGHSAEEIAPLFENYCWSTLEYDLVNARDTLTKNIFGGKIKPLIRSLRSEFDKDKSMAQLCNQLERQSNELFTKVSSWFTRPNSQSMSVSIGELINFAKQEIYELDRDKMVGLKFTGDSEFNLVGGVYHTMYDILYVLIGNVQKHSDLSVDAHLEFSTTPIKDGAQDFKLSIKSKLLPSATREVVANNIDQSIKKSKTLDPSVRDRQLGLGIVEKIIDEYHGKFHRVVSDTHCTFVIEIRVLTPGVKR